MSDLRFEWDERKNTQVDQTDKGYRRSAPSPASDGTMRVRNNSDLSYNILLDATAKHDFSRDLISRFDLRYTYEDQESNGIDESGATLTLPVSSGWRSESSTGR